MSSSADRPPFRSVLRSVLLGVHVRPNGPTRPHLLALLLLPAALLLGGIGTPTAAQDPGTELEALEVGPHGRYLQHQDGSPFFYLGDTAWELFHRLDEEEADRYLENRAAKGFTVVQAVVLAQLGGLDVPNANGDRPLEEKDPTRPNEAYFRHVDRIVERAGELGLRVGMLPTWGSHWKEGPDQIFTAENARDFGQYLGERYRDAPVIWILGGDANPDTPEERAIITAMAEGLEEGDGGAHLMTYHPRGPGLSTEQFPSAEWVDFHMYQSSHAAHDHDTGLFAEHDRAIAPPKPTLDGEPRYEAIPVGFYLDGYNRHDRFTAYDVRQAAYWSLLGGAAGHTYGNNNIWQMWAPGREPVIGASTPWYEALDHPGAFQMGHVRELFTARPFTRLRPDAEFVVDGPRTGGAKIRAMRARDSSFAFIYSPRGASFTVDQTRIAGVEVREIWYDPRYGRSHPIHTTDTKAFQTYTPPTSGRGNDWILLLENAAEDFPLPGSPETP